jgi:hypothetical protein
MIVFDMGTFCSCVSLCLSLLSSRSPRLLCVRTPRVSCTPAQPETCICGQMIITSMART